MSRVLHQHATTVHSCAGSDYSVEHRLLYVTLPIVVARTQRPLHCSRRQSTTDAAATETCQSFRKVEGEGNDPHAGPLARLRKRPNHDSIDRLVVTPLPSPLLLLEARGRRFETRHPDKITTNPKEYSKRIFILVKTPRPAKWGGRGGGVLIFCCLPSSFDR